MSHNYFVNASPQSGEGPALLTIFTDINRSKEPQKGSVQIIGETVQESIYVEQEGGLWIASIQQNTKMQPAKTCLTIFL